MMQTSNYDFSDITEIVEQRKRKLSGFRSYGVLWEVVRWSKGHKGGRKKKKEKEKRKNYFRGDFLIKKPASSRPKIGQLAHPRCINLPMRMTYMMPGINV
jgi:hypothetical protein